MANSPNPGRTRTVQPLAETPQRASILKKLRARPTVPVSYTHLTLPTKA